MRTATFLIAVSVAVPAWATPSPKGEEMKVSGRVFVQMKTSMGDILLELNEEAAPISTRNFVEYANADYYNGTIFHRVIDNFMIQGGGFTADMKQKETRPPIKNEWRNGLSNDRGTIAMARTSAPDSATSQFYINVQDNPSLDQPRGGAAYAVFGRVIHGMDVVDKIKKVDTGTRNGMGDVPRETVTINYVSVIDPASADLPAEFKEAIRSAAEDAKRAQKSKERDWEAAMQIVKGNGGDPEKGVKADSGLWYTDVTEGTGPTPPSATSTVEVHYTGWLVTGKKFDSSRDRNKTASFPLNGVISGWTEGVGSMKVGGKRILVIPPDMAYGAAGRPGIPPNSVLVFEVELIAIK